MFRRLAACVPSNEFLKTWMAMNWLWIIHKFSCKAKLVVKFVGRRWFASAAVATDVWLYGLKDMKDLKDGRKRGRGTGIGKQLFTTINNMISMQTERGRRSRRNNWAQQTMDFSCWCLFRRLAACVPCNEILKTWMITTGHNGGEKVVVSNVSC